MLPEQLLPGDPTEVNPVDTRPVRRDSELFDEIDSSSTGKIRPLPSVGMPFARASRSCAG